MEALSASQERKRENGNQWVTFKVKDLRYLQFFSHLPYPLYLDQLHCFVTNFLPGNPQAVHLERTQLGYLCCPLLHYGLSKALQYNPCHLPQYLLPDYFRSFGMTTPAPHSFKNQQLPLEIRTQIGCLNDPSPLLHQSHPCHTKPSGLAKISHSVSN